MVNPPNRKPIVTAFTSQIMTNRNHPIYDPYKVIADDPSLFENANQSNLDPLADDLSLNELPEYTVMAIKD